ncbi:MAG: phospholipase D-like domain-containing protein [Candidatus Nitrospinota bacterium M3_3B_026]
MIGDSFTLIRSAEKFYSALFEDLSRAEKSIRIQMYCIEWGRIAERLRKALIERARAGVSVDLVYDSVGSLGLPSFYFNEMVEAGARVVEYHPIDPRKAPSGFSFRALFRRNHRKLILIDSRIYYLGGMNIGERFLDWEDIMVRGEGVGPVADLEKTFKDALDKEPRPKRPLLPPRRAGSARIEVCDCRPRLHSYPMKRLYIAAIKRAKERVWIAQAYFLPRRKLAKALIHAAEKGVDVRVIIPDISDMMVVDLATWAAVKKLLRSGVKVFRFQDRMLHSKMAVIDDHWMTVGTANLDSMSFYWNLETNLVIRDPEIVENGAELFREYEAASRPVGRDEPDNRPLPLRLAGRALYYYSWIL